MDANLIAPGLPSGDALRMLNVPVANIVDLALPVVVDDVDLIVIDVDPAWSLMNDVVIPARFRWVGAIWFCRRRNRSWFCTRPPGMLGRCGNAGFVVGTSGRGILGLGMGFPPMTPGNVTGRSNPRKSSMLPGNGLAWACSAWRGSMAVLRSEA